MSNFAKFELSHHHKGLHMWMMLDLLEALPIDAVLSHSGDDMSKSVSYYTFRSKKFQKLNEAEMIPSVLIIPDYTNKKVRFGTTNTTLKELFDGRCYEEGEPLMWAQPQEDRLLRDGVQPGLVYFDEVTPEPAPPVNPEPFRGTETGFTWVANTLAIPNNYYFTTATTYGTDNG